MEVNFQTPSKTTWKDSYKEHFYHIIGMKSKKKKEGSK